MAEYTDSAGNLREAAGVFMADASKQYTDSAGNLREAVGVFIVGGGGGELLPTQAIIDDEQQITATNGQTISVAVVDNVPSLTIKNWAFWEPFTVTVGTDGAGVIRGFEEDGYGSISNQPVIAFNLYSVLQQPSGEVEVYIYGQRAIAGELQGALIGISGVDYTPSKLQSLWLEEDAAWGTLIIIPDVPAWSVDQQIPIVIIPQP